MNDDKFTKNEIKGRQYLTSLFPQYVFTYAADKYCEYDATINIFDKTNYIEIKTRNIPSYKYTSTLLEQDKFTRLKQYMSANSNVYYYCFFEDDVCLSWNIGKLRLQDIGFAAKISPATTNGTGNPILKQYITLPTVKAKKFSYKYTPNG